MHVAIVAAASCTGRPPLVRSLIDTDKPAPGLYSGRKMPRCAVLPPSLFLAQELFHRGEEEIKKRFTDFLGGHSTH